MLPYRRRAFTSPRSAEKRKKQYVIRIGAIFAVFFILSAALSWTSWRPEINIQRFAIVGNATVPEEDVRNYLEDRLRGGYLGFFSRANVFLFQPRIIEEELRTDFKKIKEVKVSRDSFQSVTVEIEERKPFYLWCGEQILEELENACYFLDIDGYAFAPAPYFSGHVYFEFFRPFEEENKNPVGTYFLPESEFKRLIAFRNALREIGIEARAFHMSETGDYSFTLTEETKIFFHPKQDFDILFHNLVATFDTEQFIRKKKSDFFLEYIDLRFDNKVYYRFK